MSDDGRIIQFDTPKQGIAWFCRERSRRFGRGRNLDMTAVRATLEEQAATNKTYAAMVECLAVKDPRGGDDLHEALGRAVVVSVIGRGTDQQHEADRRRDVVGEDKGANDVVEWSATYAGHGLEIVSRRMRERDLIKPHVGAN